MMNASSIGVLATLSAGVLWGFLGLFVRELTAAGFTPVQMTCIRYIIVALVIGTFVLVRGRGIPRVTKGDVALFALMGIVGTAINSVCYFTSMGHISLSLATVLQYLSPFIVVMLSIPLFRERLTRGKCLALISAFAGCILCTGVISDPGSMNIYGIALGLASGVCYSFYTIGSKEAATRGHHTATIMLYSSIFCAVLLMPFSDLGSSIPSMSSSSRNLLLMLGLGILMTLIPFGLYNIGVSKMDAGKAAIITYVEPLAATVVGLIAYGEDVTFGVAAGLILILLSLIVLERSRDVYPSS